MARCTFSNHSLTPPAWAAGPLDHHSLIPGGARLEPSQFLAENAVRVTATANAAANATSVTVSALSKPIPAGAVLDFGGAKFATLTSAANAGATTLAVRALVTALVANDTAVYPGDSPRKPVIAGTLIGRTFAERDAGTGFGPAVVASDDEIYLLAFDVTDAAFEPNCELYRHQCLVKENFLPNWATMTGQEKAKVRELYETIAGIA